MHPRADPDVVAWVDAQPVNEVYLTAVTTAELRYGVARLPDGRRKTDLADRVRRTVEEDLAPCAYFPVRPLVAAQRPMSL